MKVAITTILLFTLILVLNWIQNYIGKIYPSLDIVSLILYYGSCFYIGWSSQDVHNYIWNK